MIFPSYHRRVRPQTGRQLFLDNNSVVHYPFVTSKAYHGVVYVPTYKKLVIAVKYPDELWEMSLYDNKTVQKLKIPFVTTLAADGVTENVFVCTGRGIRKMTLGNQNLPLIVKKRCFLGYVAADHKRSLIYYVCGNHKIIQQFTYAGEPKKNISGTQSASRLLVNRY